MINIGKIAGIYSMFIVGTLRRGLGRERPKIKNVSTLSGGRFLSSSSRQVKKCNPISLLPVPTQKVFREIV